MKICTKCQQNKELNEFNIDKKNNRTFSWCIECMKNNNKVHYLKNREERLKRHGIKNKEKSQFLYSLKEGKKCEKCGCDKPYMLDFHHIDPNQKEITIADFSRKRGLNDKNKIYEELEKCIILCSNCHREFHYLERKEKIILEQYLKTLAVVAQR